MRDAECRGIIARYLSGQASLDELRRWIARESWNVEAREDADTAAVLREVELLLAEYDHGDWSEAELHERLVPFVSTYTIRLGAPAAIEQRFSGASGDRATRADLVQSEPVHTELSGAA